MTRSRAALLVASLLLAATGCQDPSFLGDAATCPGETCTDDAQARVDVIAALDGVTGVEQVSRKSGLDRGTFHSAVVTADVDGADEARDVALLVLRELDSWPERNPGSALATVVADPPRTVPGAARGSNDLPPYYDPCAGRACREGMEELQDRLVAELDGVTGVAVRVVDDRLLISGDAEPEQATYAVRGTLMVLEDLRIALADRVEIRFTYRGPLEVTLRLANDLVCEQPPGDAVVSCDEDNSIPFVQ